MESDNQSAKIEIILIKPILYTQENPTTIAYAKDLAAIKNKQIEYLPVQAFEAIVRQTSIRKNFCWTENVCVDKSSLYKKLIAQEHYIDTIYQKSLEGLAIVNMGESLGHGVVTLNPISKGTIVTHYAGIITRNISKKPDYEDILSSYKVRYNDYIIDAYLTGNIASFIQDAPTEIELKNEFIISKVLAEQVATENLNFGAGILQGCEVVYLQAIRDIQPGELLLISYGKSYWSIEYLLKNVSRILFAKDGKPMPPGLYQHLGDKIMLKYDAKNLVELSYASIISAYQKQQKLRYEFTPNNGRQETRELAIDDIHLIMQRKLWTTAFNPAQLPLKVELAERINKEYQLQKIIWPVIIEYYAAFYSKALSLLKAQPAGDNDNQAIAFLLQALLLAIKEARTAQVIAPIYFDLANAYASKAYQEQNIYFMQTAIYLLKKSLKLLKSPEKIQKLREYKHWLRKHASLSFYWRDYIASLRLYLQTL